MSVVTAAKLLFQAPDYGSPEYAELLDWAVRQAIRQERDWVLQLVLELATEGSFDDDAVSLLEPILTAGFVYCLDNRRYSLAEDFLLSVVGAMDDSPPFGRHHAYCAFRLGFALHFLGAEGAATPRQNQPEASLVNLRDWYEAKLTTLRYGIVRNPSIESVTNFATLLHRLADAHIAPLSLISQMYNLIEDVYPFEVISEEAVSELACMLGALRWAGRDADEEDGHDGHTRDEFQDWLDEHAAHLALYAETIGGEDRDLTSSVISNARMRPVKKMPRRLANDQNFDERIYQEVAKAAGLLRWPR